MLSLDPTAAPDWNRCVSVVIPCWNQGHFVAEAIESIRSDTRPVEIIVVDDGSTDNTAQVVQGFPRVKYIRQANQGVAAARNRGLGCAMGSFVVFLDADDRLLSTAIDVGAHALESRPQCAMTIGRCRLISSDGAVLPAPVAPRLDSELRAAVLQDNPIWMPGVVMFRRTHVEAQGGFRRGFDAAAEYDLYLRILAVAPVHDHGELVAIYRRHGKNISCDSYRMLHDIDRVMRRNRPAERSLRSAWRHGRRMFRTFYLAQLTRDMHMDVQHGRRRDAAMKMLALARWSPLSACRETAKLARNVSGDETNDRRYA